MGWWPIGQTGMAWCDLCCSLPINGPCRVEPKQNRRLVKTLAHLISLFLIFSLLRVRWARRAGCGDVSGDTVRMSSGHAARSWIKDNRGCSRPDKPHQRCACGDLIRTRPLMCLVAAALKASIRAHDLRVGKALYSGDLDPLGGWQQVSTTQRLSPCRGWHDAKRVPLSSRWVLGLGFYDSGFW
jgi:hypothetical protein